MRLIAAVVVAQTSRSMIFRFADRREGPRYTSGAPLINDRGEVVGINIGAGVVHGCRYGHAPHVDSIHRHLAISIAAVVERR